MLPKPTPRAGGIGREIGRLLLEPRRALGLTREQLASQVARKEGTIQRWESGERVPSAKDVETLATALTDAPPPSYMLVKASRAREPSASPLIRVFLVEDDDQIREATKGSLGAEAGISVIGEAGSADAAYRAILADAPDIAIIDIRLGQTSGLDLAKEIRAARPQTKVLILSGYDYPQYIRRAAAIGIEGYLTKDAPTIEIARTIRRIVDGENVLPLKIASRVLGCVASGISDPPEAHRLRSLTLREIETLELIGQDLNNQDIATHLGVSLKTVEDHVSGVLKKLHVHRRGQAVRITNQLGGIGRVVPE